ncbi:MULTISPECIES: hypothetical protein [Dermabacter]|uniref:hypothetical protein n=1 Tax=Dermabacter TaxID=36739 RepID=UPI0008A63396|nr:MULTISPECIES: hypothetical protein [Dermabacter]MCT1955191.1 hypothetical protein [Dermabacter hominis]MCT2055212.1 hypothetical protein [Dermabacter hominis]MCT2083684.1 hypothetical protein [Dermabacter hominis]MCT2090770.1 hypothetical protein [Dermabacter hominis]MCT2189413.1 hypothetical protein [Dermabacter hominis]
MDIQNHYYGHSAALARYTGEKSVRHIDGLVQHGWTVASPTLVHFSDFAKLPRTARRLVWSHHSRAWDAQRDDFPTTAIGAPWLYLSALAREVSLEPLGKTVAFPVHSTRLVKIDSANSGFAKELARREGPAVVCVHPEDLADPAAVQVWKDHGHEVVSAGDRRDPNFLGRILYLVRAANRVVSNQLSTAVVYAAAEGTPTEIYGPAVAVGSLGTTVSTRTQQVWPEFFESSSVEARTDIALAELGIDDMREPDELRELLGWDKRHVRPWFDYWCGAPLRKAGAVLGIVKRPDGAQDAGSGNSPLAFLKHPFSHLPGPLPRIATHDLLPTPLTDGHQKSGGDA